VFVSQPRKYSRSTVTTQCWMSLRMALLSISTAENCYFGVWNCFYVTEFWFRMRLPLPRCCSAKCLCTSLYTPYLRTMGNPNPETRRSSENTGNVTLYRSVGLDLRIRICHCWYDGNILVILTSTCHTPSNLCTLIPCFSRIRTSRSRKFVGSTEEYLYISPRHFNG
jgi:hypothetical protein